MASTLCMWPIIAALLSADGISNTEKLVWQTRGNEGQHFLAHDYKKVEDFIAGPSTLPSASFTDKTAQFIQDYFQKDPSQKELVTKASQDVNVINDFMEKNGFGDMKLTDLNDPTAWYIAALLDLKEKWTIPGNKSSIQYQTKKYDAVHFATTEAFDVYQVPTNDTAQSTAVLSMKTQNGDKVYMALADKPRKGFDILEHVRALTPSATVQPSFYDEVYFPMVKLDQRCDPTWLVGATKTLPDGNWRIMEAIQQTRFSMDELGAEVQSMVAISMIFETSCYPLPKNILTIDKPFYVWVIRPGLVGDVPLFAAYCDETVWKEKVA